MKGQPNFRPRAVEDLDGITASIAAANPGAARSFQMAIEQAVELLLHFPDLGPRVQLDHPDLADLRLWQLRRFKNYLIFYRPIETGIEIVRILHGARQWQEELER